MSYFDNRVAEMKVNLFGVVVILGCREYRVLQFDERFIGIHFVRYIPTDRGPEPTLDTLAAAAARVLGCDTKLRDVGSNIFRYWTKHHYLRKS